MAYTNKRKTYKRKTYKKRATKKTGMVATIKRIVNKTIMKKAESKQLTQNYGVLGTTQLYHNVMLANYLNGPTGMPLQGLSDTSRIGDKINVGGFYIRALCAHKNDRPNLTWKFYVMSIPKGTSPTYARCFENISGNVLIDNPNKDNVRVLKTLTKKCNSPNAYSGSGPSYLSREITFPIKIWIPYKKQYTFCTDNSSEHQDRDLYLVTFVYDSVGTLVTDNVASFQLISTMYYKDP